MTTPVVEDDVVERLRRWAALAGDDQSVLKRDLLEAAALIEQQRNTIEELRSALSETLGNLCSQLEWETGLTDIEINERPEVVKARALLQGDKKE